MPIHRLSAVVLLAALPLCAHAAGTRTHVSNAGNDANTAFSCDSAHPCRTFAAALTVTTPGGEILAIDSSGYGKVTIDRSVSIVAAPGVYAGIGVGSGNGVTISTSGVSVILRGLALTGQGGSFGIYMGSGTSLAVERCTLSGFTGGNTAIAIEAPAAIHIVDSTIRDNTYGIHLRSGANAAISRSTISGNTTTGVLVRGNSAGATTTVSISDTTMNGNYIGVHVHSNTAGAAARADVFHSTATNGAYGLASEASDGTANIRLSASLVSRNSTGLYQADSGSGTATFSSFGNNTVTDNAIPTAGVISPALTM